MFWNRKRLLLLILFHLKRNELIANHKACKTALALAQRPSKKHELFIALREAASHTHTGQEEQEIIQKRTNSTRMVIHVMHPFNKKTRNSVI